MRTLLVLLGCAWCMSGAFADDRPNIVVVLVDDMGWSNLGCYGGQVETPHLDRLAKNGVRFNQFYNSARCCPTRAALMTGLHPHEVGIGFMSLSIKRKPTAGPTSRKTYFPVKSPARADIPAAYRGWMDTDVTTLPERLKRAGYATFMAGKWHLANECEETWPLQRGFDRFYGHLSGVSDFFQPANLFQGNEPIEPEGAPYYLTDDISTKAISMLEDHESATDDQPFFLYLAYNAPHYPMQCMPAEFQKYRGRFRHGWDELRARRLAKQKEMRLVPSSTNLAPRPDVVPAWSSLTPKQQDELDAIMATYAGMVDRVDQNIGRLVSHLKEAGELDNTLLFFLSDNGAEAECGPLGQFKFEDLGKYGSGGLKYGKGWATVSNTPFREYKQRTYQGGVQTPLIVHWPKGIRLGAAVSSEDGPIVTACGYVTDIVETCLGVAETAMKHEYGSVEDGLQRDGVSLLGLLQGESSLERDQPICIEHQGHRVVRDNNWKLVSYFQKPWELFDVELDRSESHDLSSDHPEVKQRLLRTYRSWADRVGVIPWQYARLYSVYRKPKEEMAPLSLKFEGNFEEGSDRWELWEPNSRNTKEQDGNLLLEATRREGGYNSPALIENMNVGDFELTFRIRSAEESSGHRDCGVYFGIQDKRRFYCLSLGGQAESQSGQILIAKNDAQRALTQSKERIPWDKGWHDVKVVRRLESGRIEVYLDDMDRPHLWVRDDSFRQGRIGFSSSGGLNEFDDIRLIGN